MGAKKLSPAEKAGIVLLALGEDASAPLLKKMPRNELVRALQALSGLGAVDHATAQEVLQEFSQNIKKGEKGLHGDPQAAKRLLSKALPGERETALDTLLSDGNTELMAVLRELDIPLIASFCAKEEAPQIAVTLAHMDPVRGAACLKLLPERLRTTVLEKLAALGPVAPEALDALASTFRELRGRAHAPSGKALGGADKVAALINSLDRPSSQALIQNLAERSPLLAETVQGLLFQFADLARLTDRSIAEILKAVPPETLKIAVKSAPDAVTQAVFRNISKRAQSMLREDIAALGLVKKSAVETAQQTIAALARRLIDEGKIPGPGDSSDFV